MDMALLQASVDRLHDVFDRSDLEIEAVKIEQKMNEARYSPGNVRPLADCVFSVLLAARSGGFSVKAVFDELQRVAEANLAHRWKKMDDGTYQHTE